MKNRGQLFSAAEIHRAYLDCRRGKRSTPGALRFEMSLAENLLALEEELNAGSYRPSRSVCFITLKPKPREIFAADFRDRVVHHLLVRTIEPYWERVFIHDSYACRKGRGTHAAVDRVASFVRSVTRGGGRRAFFLQVDVHNFFMSIDRRTLFAMVDKGLRRQLGVPSTKLPLFCPRYPRYLALRRLAETLIFHDATADFTRKSPPNHWRHIAEHKSLFNCAEGKGLPIGNLTSQFFGNVYLNALDQFVKHELEARHYVRYVDDGVIVHESKEQLTAWHDAISDFLTNRLSLKLNQGATKLKPVSCGINFLGYIVHPTHRLVRRRVAGSFASRLRELERTLVNRTDDRVRYRYDEATLEELLASVSSYLAHFAKAQSRGLLQRILAEHPWIACYLRLDTRSFEVERAWRPPRDFPTLARQYGWFRRRYPGAIIFFQVGTEFELYGRDAQWAQRSLGLAKRGPRFERRPRTTLRPPLLREYRDAAIAGGLEDGRDEEDRDMIVIVTVIETGYPLRRLRQRCVSDLQVRRRPAGEPVICRVTRGGQTQAAR